MPEIRVFLADDHAVLRSGLKLLINTQSDMRVIGEAGDFPSTKEKAAELAPDVLVLDLSMPGGDPAVEIEQIASRLPKTRLLILTMHDDSAMFRMAVAHGVAGYIVKSAADTELLTAIRTVAEGRSFMSLSGKTPMALSESNSGDEPQYQELLQLLSQREVEVLKLVAQGHTNQSIADRLYLSVKTIESYRSRLMAKLKLSTRAELTQFALHAGLLK